MKLKSRLTLRKTGRFMKYAAGTYEQIEILFANSILIGSIHGNKAIQNGLLVHSPGGLSGSVLKIATPYGCDEADVSAAFINFADLPTQLSDEAS